MEEENMGKRMSNLGISSDVDYTLYDRKLCLSKLIYGVTADKVSSRGRAKTKKFYLYEHNNLFMFWTSDQKKYGNSFFNLAFLTRIERKPTAKCFKNYKGQFNPEKIATLTFKNSTLALIFHQEKDLLYFLSGIHYLLDETAHLRGRKNSTQGTVVNLLWGKSDINQSGTLSFEEIKKMMVSMNIHLNNSKLSEIFTEFDENNNQLIERHEFDKLIEQFLKNASIDNIFLKYSGASENLKRKRFHRFISEIQNNDNYKKIFSSFCEEINGKIRMPMKKFRDYIMNPYLNPILAPDHLNICMDMTQPLTHYFIASSHNTYLEGNQLTGTSSVSQYKQVLLEGCRCVEIDTWDGPKYPIVTHGHTLVNSIPLKDVIIEIKQSAFVFSPYPVILSFENHCSTKQTGKIGKILREVLIDHLYIPEFNLKSPEELKYKFIIKGKVAKGSKPTHPEFAEIVALHGSTFGFDKAMHQIVSIKETKLNKLVKEHGSEEIIKNHCKTFSRIYPKASRVKSSNYNPLDHWIFGAQMAAINYQAYDLGKLINSAWFTGNGRSGYILKPSYLRNDPSIDLLSSTSHISPTILSVQIISAFNLPKPSSQNAIISPYIEVSTIGIPDDSASLTTSIVKHNGFTPTWNEEFRFPIKFPELCILLIKVFSKHKRDTELIGMNAIPLYCVNPGIRSVQLLNEQQVLLQNSLVICKLGFS